MLHYKIDHLITIYIIMLDLSYFHVKLLSELLSFMASHVFLKLVFSIYFHPEHAVTAASRHHMDKVILET